MARGQLFHPITKLKFLVASFAKFSVFTVFPLLADSALFADPALIEKIGNNCSFDVKFFQNFWVEKLLTRVSN
jgi:hypothetical protein